jgi:hypothetical protein
VFSGIGRMLLAAERQGRGPAHAEPEARPTRPGQAGRTAWRPQRARAAQPVAQSRWRSLDQTGNVRLLAADDIDDGPVIVAAGVNAVAAVPAPVLPLASYDSLSLASIRARLRTLDAGQLRVLLQYERTNAERAEVLGMLERRLEKLESGG